MRRHGLFPAGGGEHEVDHRPAQAEQQPDRAGQVGDREVRALRVATRVPGDDRLDRELGQGLEPREDREGEALGDEELRGFRAPGDEKRRRENAGERPRSEEHTSELQSLAYLVCRLLLEKKKKKKKNDQNTTN